MQELLAENRAAALIDHKYANYAMKELFNLVPDQVNDILLRRFAQHAVAEYGNFVLKEAIRRANDWWLTRFRDAFVANMSILDANRRNSDRIRTDLEKRLVARKMEGLGEHRERRANSRRERPR